MTAMMSARKASAVPVSNAAASASVSAGVVGNGLIRTVLVLVSLAIFVALCSALAQQVWRWLDKPVTEVRVLGDARHLNKVELAQRLGAGLNAPLLQLDLAGVRDRLLDEPWVHGARIRRDWPPAIEVHIDEEVPVARWGDKGLLNHEGDIFWPELKPEYATLPRLGQR